MNKKNKLLNGNDLLIKQIRYAFSSSGNMEMGALVTMLALWHGVKNILVLCIIEVFTALILRTGTGCIGNGRTQPIISNITINISGSGN